jgi:hypothetical protein
MIIYHTIMEIKPGPARLSAHRAVGRILGGRSEKVIRGAVNAAGTAVQDVGIDHRCLQALVTQQFLDGPRVVSQF